MRAVPEDNNGPNTSCFVLAGGVGDRLRPLTLTTPKPMLPFGGVHRLLDFTLSNVRNSGISRAYVLSQYLHEDIGRHLRMYWTTAEPEAPTVVLNQPPTSGKRYRGTADAVAQNLESAPLSSGASDPVLVLSADHVYQMDYRKLLLHHERTGAGVTVAAIPVPLNAASHFGVISADGSGRVLGFDEKPESPAALPGARNIALANMGVYVFNRWILGRALAELRERQPALDFGRHVLPWMAQREMAGVYRVSEAGGGAYWKDVGTLCAYHESHMELVDGRLGFDTFDARWPVRSMEDRVVREAGGSLIAASAVVGDARVERSVVGVGVVVEDGADVRDSVLLSGVRVGSGAAIRNAIVAAGGRIEARDSIGFDANRDLERFGVTQTGVVVVPPDRREHVRIVATVGPHNRRTVGLMAG